MDLPNDLVPNVPRQEFLTLIHPDSISGFKRKNYKGLPQLWQLGLWYETLSVYSQIDSDLKE